MTFKPCIVAGCNGNASWRAFGALGMCGKHYHRAKRYGAPNGGPAFHGEAHDWLKRHVCYVGDECLTWPYNTYSNGYGRVRSEGRDQVASAVMCELAHGPKPTSRHECAHSCGNGHLGCVNPHHLRWATRSENLMDRPLHGTAPRGEAHYRAKLTPEDVRAIRSMRGVVSQREIGKRYGVSASAVDGIHRGVNWSWLA